MKGETNPPREIQIGGQAVIEGVVMRGPDRWALAVRRPCGSMYVTVNPVNTLAQRYPRLNRFPLRGIFVLADSLIIGLKSLSISANISLEEEDRPDDRPEAPPETEGPRDEPAAGGVEGEKKEKTGRDYEKPVGTWEFAVALFLGLVLFLGLFIALPTVIGWFLDDYVQNTVVYNIIEGFIRVAIFVAYLAAMSLLPDMKRLFAYHGAEHKVVHAYERGLPLTPESARPFTTAHMRCGTTFVVIVFVISILVFSVFGRPALWLRIVERIAIVPLVAAVSYEIIKLAGRYEDSTFMKVLMAPGLWLQKLTTREPDDEQLQVAIDALNAAVAD